MTRSVLKLTPLLGLALVGALSLSGCGSSATSSTTTMATDPLTFTNTTIPAAYVGEDFRASTLVSGGVGPYAYRVASGTLPPGVSMSGGTLSGKPTQAGTYQFSIEANDANLSNKVAQYTINVTDLPPTSLEPTLPPGEIRGETRVPLVIKAPRQVRAARVTWDLGPNVQVQGVEGTDNSTLVMWKQSGTLLTVDMGFKAVPRSGTRVAMVMVKPQAAVKLDNSKFWYDSRDGKGKVLGEKKNPAAAQATAATNAATTSTGTASTGATGTTTSTSTSSAATLPTTTDQSKLPSPASGTPATAPTSPSTPATSTPTTTSPTTTSPVTPPVTTPGSGK